MRARDSLKWIIISMCLTMLQAVVVDQAVIRKHISDRLIRKLSPYYEKVNIKFTNQPQISLSEKQYDIQVKLPERIVGFLTVPVIIKGKKQRLKKYFPVDVSVFDNVMVTEKTISRFKPIEKEAVKQACVDVTQYVLQNRQLFKDKSKIVNKYRSNRFIPRGTVLRDDFVERVPVIVKNAELDLWVKMASFAVKMRVMALDDGNIGDTIKVKNPRYEKILFARVLSGKEAILEN